MWFWKRPDLSDRITTLSRRVDDAEDQLKKIRREWADVEEKLGRLAGRLAKRASRDLERALAEEPPAAPANGEEPPASDDEVTKRRQRWAFPGGAR